MMIGFGRADITPRIGVDLCGFGPFRNRRAIAVRDRLWTRAMAVSAGGRTVVVVSCDLVGVRLATTHQVRALVQGAVGLPPEAVMVHCTHTHSGPATGNLHGWGRADTPYLEILPQRIARACVAAVESLQEATLGYAEVPCEGIALNREQDRNAPPLDEVLREDWRPASPELTDTTCHVLRVDAGGEMLGFASRFGCHPVVCCEETRYIHGDFVGVATNLLEREHPGATGLFLQGAQGDINSCVCHKPEKESLLALDTIAARYANCVRRGLRLVAPIEVDEVRGVLREVTFPRVRWSLDTLRAKLAEQEALFAAPDASDEDHDLRMAAVYAEALRLVIGRVEAGLPVGVPTELQGIRIGPISLLGTPLEVFREVKNDIERSSVSKLPLVLGITNDTLGYAPDHETAARGGYAADTVPLLTGSLPFDGVHDRLVAEALAVDAALQG
jgi:hypothetical protein